MTRQEFEHIYSSIFDKYTKNGCGVVIITLKK